MSGSTTKGGMLRGILVVDDNETNRLVLERMLSKSGWTVDSASDGRQAVDKFLKRRYDMVLMDLRMPAMDGFEAVGVMRRFERESNHDPTPIVALSAHIPESDPDIIREAGFTTSLAKPVSKVLLMELVEQYASLDARTQADAGAVSFTGAKGLDESARDEHKTGPDKLPIHVDPEFNDLASWVVGRLKARLGDVDSLLMGKNWEMLRTIGHDIRGEGGTIGLTELEGFGKALRDAAVARDAQRVRDVRHNIMSYLDRVVFV